LITLNNPEVKKAGFSVIFFQILAVHIFNFTRGMSYPNLLFVASLG